MNEKNDMTEETEELKLEPADEAKESMREAVEVAAEEAEPQPTTQIDGEADRPADEEPEQPTAEDEEAIVVDLNTATEEELEQLPGIGPALAASIVSQRDEVAPFKEAAELTHVPGISESLYERIAGQVTVSPVEISEPVKDLEPEAEADEKVRVEETPILEAEPFEDEEILIAELDEDEEIAEPEPDLTTFEEDDIPTPVPGPLPSWAAASSPPQVGWGRFLLVGLLSALLGAVLTLAILYAMNGTLNFRAAANRTIQAETDRLENRFSKVDGALVGMDDRFNEMDGALMELQALAPQMEEAQARLENLEQAQAMTQAEIAAMSEGLEAAHTALGGMGEQVALLEGNVGVLGRQVSELEWQIGTMKEQLVAVTEELRDLRQATGRFNAFLEGLRHMLNEQMGPPTPTAWITPTPLRHKSTPTPTPWQTATPAAAITVIPLATPTPTP